jgi:mRNA interferase MazF
MSKATKTPKRGEIWDVDCDPPKGAEISKKRPAVVISEDAIGRLPLRIVVPITEWDARYAGYPWFVRIAPFSSNGLNKDSGADAFQVKSISERRFVRRRGALTASQLDDIAAAIAICVGVP